MAPSDWTKTILLPSLVLLHHYIYMHIIDTPKNSSYPPPYLEGEHFHSFLDFRIVCGPLISTCSTPYPNSWQLLILICTSSCSIFLFVISSQITNLMKLSSFIFCYSDGLKLAWDKSEKRLIWLSRYFSLF